MYTYTELVVAVLLSSLITAAIQETLHWIKDRKKEKVDK